MFNTIILLRGSARYTNSEYKKFEKGDTIWGNDSDPEELQRWSIDQKEEAQKELSSYSSHYLRYNEHLISVEEYALEYCEVDEDGDFVCGSDYDLAEEN